MQTAVFLWESFSQMAELGFVLHLSFTHKYNSPKFGNTWDADTIRQHAVLYAFHSWQKKWTTWFTY